MDETVWPPKVASAFEPFKQNVSIRILKKTTAQ